ncbi:hypothetical protein M8C21_011508, partial [Ambrosia artemisiifolia]
SPEMENGDDWLAHDKLQHFLLCFSITIIVSFLASRTKYSLLRHRSTSLASLLSLTAGAAKEFADELGFFQSAGASVKDAVADIIGVVVAVLLFQDEPALLRLADRGRAGSIVHWTQARAWGLPHNRAQYLKDIYKMEGQFEVIAAASVKSEEERFEEWMKKYNKKYESDEEKAARFKSFLANLRVVDAQCARGFNSMALNQYSDLTIDEMEGQYGAVAASDRFHDWMKKYNKIYQSHEEKAARFNSFLGNLRLVDDHYARGFNSMALDQYSDLNIDEYFREVFGCEPAPPSFTFSSSDSDDDLAEREGEARGRRLGRGQ